MMPLYSIAGKEAVFILYTFFVVYAALDVMLFICNMGGFFMGDQYLLYFFRFY
jgi:hypothetical protein